MSTQLIPSHLLPDVSKEELNRQLVPARTYFPALRLFDDQSKAVKQEKAVPAGEFSIAYGLGKYLTLGPEINVIIVSERQRASINDGGRMTDYFDPESAEFKAIAEQANENNQSYLAGYEFLIYEPTSNEFVAMFLTNKTAKQATPAMRAQIGFGTRLRVKQAKNKDYSWWSFEVGPSATPIERPTDERILGARELFENPRTTAEEAKKKRAR